MTWDPGVVAVGVTATAAFAVGFHVSGLVNRAQSVLSLAREAWSVIADRTLDEEGKESVVQSAALRLFGLFGLITLTAILVVAIPALVMLGGELIGLATFSAVSAFLLRWETIVGATVAVVLLLTLVRRR